MRRLERKERCGDDSRLGAGTVEEVAGKKDRSGIKLPCDVGHARGKSRRVHVAQMHVAHQQRRAAAPGLRQPLQRDGDTPHPQKAGIDEAVDTERKSRREQSAGKPRPDCEMLRTGQGNAQYEID